MFFLKDLYREQLPDPGLCQGAKNPGRLSSRKSLNAKRSSEVYSSDGKPVQFIKSEEVRPSHSKKGLAKEANPGNCDTLLPRPCFSCLTAPSLYFTPAHHPPSLVIMEWPLLWRTSCHSSVLNAGM